MTPLSRSVSVTTGCQSQIGLKPGTGASPSVRLQSRKGNERIPVISARRPGRPGIDSGMTRSKRSESPARSSRFGVSAGESPSKALT